MSYVINSDFLDVDFRQQHIVDLLTKYTHGEDFSKSQVWEWAMRTLKRGDWWFYGLEKLPKDEWEHAIQMRQKQIIALYEDIRENGYNGSIISVYFDKETGEVHTYDGFHRLSIIKYLGRNYDMNCKVSYHHPTREDMRGDFPLRERLIELNSGKNLYQPINDKRVADFKLWRWDTKLRLDAVLPSLVSGSVLDVGCETGWFSRQLARRGHNVTALESNKKRLALARYLSIINNQKIDFHPLNWQEALSICGRFDNILLLSVLHHDMLANGVDQTWKDLETLRGRCSRLIVEFPLSAESVAWFQKARRDEWKYSLEEFTELLAEATNMDVCSITYVHPARPIVVLENSK